MPIRSSNQGLAGTTVKDINKALSLFMTTLRMKHKHLKAAAPFSSKLGKRPPLKNKTAHVSGMDLIDAQVTAIGRVRREGQGKKTVVIAFAGTGVLLLMCT